MKGDPYQQSLFDLDVSDQDEPETEPAVTEPVVNSSQKSHAPTRSWSQVMDFCEDLIDDTGVWGEPYSGTEGAAGHTPDGGLIPIQGSWSGVQGVGFTRYRGSFTAVPIGMTGDPMVSEAEIAQDYTFRLTRLGRIEKSEIVRFRKMFKNISAPDFMLDRRPEPQ